MKRSIYAIIVLLLVLVLGACSKNAENEHLPEYCQTYTGFASIASADLFELLSDAGYEVNRFNYLSVISEIELEFEVDEVGREIDLGGLQCFQNLTSLTLSGRSFKDISEISALSNIQSIEIYNTSIVSIDSFKNLSKINNLVIHDTLTLQNADGVGEMTKLTSLDLSENGLVNVGELNALTNLQHLYLNNNEILVFPSINNLVLLETLDISHNKINQLGDDLSGLNMLETLDMSYNDICDISSLDDLESLRELDLSFNNLGCVGNGVSPNFDSLENAPFLHTLKLNDNNLTSIEGLRDRNISLQVLHLQNNQLTDITPIGEYTDITDLVLYNNNIVNIDDLSGMTGLSEIDLSNNDNVDFSDLLNIPNLTTVNLSNNNISVIPDLSTAWPTLDSLDLHNNNLTDVSGVEGHPTLRSLHIYNSGLTTLEGISYLPELADLVIYDQDYEMGLAIAGSLEFNSNVISTITNSFNDTPKVLLYGTGGVLTLPFIIDDGLEIYDSFTDDSVITLANGINVISLADLNIDVINENSFQYNNVSAIYVQGNNLTDIRFIFGNPDLTTLVISSNPITNISIISGVDTDDLDNLETVTATNVPGSISLLNAFIELPSLEVVNLSATEVTSISNSFNQLPQFRTLSLNSTNLTAIASSFNGIYETYRTSNMLNFGVGRVGIITDSFNGGSYYSISMSDQSGFGFTLISGSFNDLSVEDRIALDGSSFSTITDSFNDTIADDLYFRDADIQVITDSFTNSEVTTLDLCNNKLQSVPSLNTIGSVSVLSLCNNQLNTVAFIDSVNGLQQLDILNQENDLSVKTLTTIDGVNNLPDLELIWFEDNAITEITGLQNIGLTSLNFAYDLTGTVITDIGADAFKDTPLEVLMLTGNAISTLDFLDNLISVEILEIGLNVADFSAFSGVALEGTLTSITIENVSTEFDFSAFQNYTALSSIYVNSTVEYIDNLSNIDSLNYFYINDEDVLEISNSFNNLPNYLDRSMDMADYTNITLIDNSFDIIGDTSPQNTVVIPGNVAVTGSFVNAVEARIEGNSGDSTPNFDTTSFTNVTGLSFEYANYSTYAFFNDYEFLELVQIDNLQSEISDLNNANITGFAIASANSLLQDNTIFIAPEGTVEISSARAGAMSVTSNVQIYVLDTPNAIMTINSSIATSLIVDGEYNILTVDSSEISSFQFYGTTNSITFNTENLATITEDSGADIGSATIYTDVASLDITLGANITVIGSSLLGVSVVAQLNNVTLQTSAATLDVDVTAALLYILNDNLTTLTGDMDVDVVELSNPDLDTIQLSTSSITDFTLESTLSTLDLIIPNASNVLVYNDYITDFTFDTPNADVVVYRDNTNAMTIDGTSDTFDIIDSLISEFTIADTSDISSITLDSIPSIVTVVFGNATIDTLEVATDAVALSITGVSNPEITLQGDNVLALTVDVPGATIQAENVANGAVAELYVDTFVLDGTANSFVIDSNSIVDTIETSANSVISSLNTNDVSIRVLNITTSRTSLNVDALNVTTTTILGTSISTITVDTLHDVILTVGALSVSGVIVADTVTIDGASSTITLFSGTTVDTLSIDVNGLSTVTTNDSEINSATVISDAGTLDITGSDIVELEVQGAMDTIDLAINPVTVVTIISTYEAGTVSVYSTTLEIDLTASTDVFIDSDVVEILTINTPGDVIFISEKIALSIIISGSSNEYSILADDLASLTFGSGTSFESFYLSEGGTINTLDFTDTNISTASIETILTEFTVNTGNLTDLVVSSSDLTTLNVTGQSVLGLSLGATSFTLIGHAATTNINDPNLTSINLSSFTTDALELNASNLAELTLSNTVTNVLEINTNVDNFELTTDIQTIDFNSDETFTLILNSTLASSMILTTNVEILTLSAVNTDINLEDDNINMVEGVVNNLVMSGSTQTNLAFDLTATTVTVTSTDNLQHIAYLPLNTVDQLDITVNGALVGILTDDAEIGTMIVRQNTTTTLQILTKVEDIQVIAEILGGTTRVEVFYEGNNPLVVSFTDLNESVVGLTDGSTVTIEGNVLDLDVYGSSLTTLTTTDLTVSGIFTMDDTLIQTLGFASTTFLSSLQELHMNTLLVSEVGNVIDTLEGTNVTLYSPVGNQDIYDYIYADRYTTLEAQEAIDHVRYDTFRATAVDDSWAEIQANQYMDHLEEVATRAAIDGDTMGDEQFYFDSYLTDAGLTVGDLAIGEEATIRAAISATLLTIEGLMDEIGLQDQVTSSLEDDAETYTASIIANKTYTIVYAV